MTPRQTAVLALFVGPFACAIDQLVSYALVYKAATSRGTSALIHGTTAVAAALVIVGLFFSWRVLRLQGEQRVQAGMGGVDRFLAVTAFAMNLFFLLVVVVGFGLPQLLLHPTD
jgi:hypothetical protein